MYFVFELQKTANGQCSVLPYHDDSWTFAQAESVYHGKVSYAAISDIPVHTIMFVDVDGSVYEHKTYIRE